MRRFPRLAVRHAWARLTLATSAILSLVPAVQLGAAPPRKPTHVLQPVQIEAAVAKPNGNAWDTGFGAFTRPDPQVTVIRHDPDAQRRALELLVLAQERRLRELGQPVDADIRRMLATGAARELTCGAQIAALQDAALTKARAEFAADTQVANDTVLAKLAGGDISVAIGDMLTVFVNDIDLAAHDVMGEYALTVTRELLAKGEVELKFSAVESLRLKLAPLKP